MVAAFGYMILILANLAQVDGIEATTELMGQVGSKDNSGYEPTIEAIGRFSRVEVMVNQMPMVLESKVGDGNECFDAVTNLTTGVSILRSSKRTLMLTIPYSGMDCETGSLLDVSSLDFGARVDNDMEKILGFEKWFKECQISKSSEVHGKRIFELNKEGHARQVVIDMSTLLPLEVYTAPHASDSTQLKIQFLNWSNDAFQGQVPQAEDAAWDADSLRLFTETSIMKRKWIGVTPVFNFQYFDESKKPTLVTHEEIVRQFAENRRIHDESIRSRKWMTLKEFLTLYVANKTQSKPE